MSDGGADVVFRKLKSTLVEGVAWIVTCARKSQSRRFGRRRGVMAGIQESVRGRDVYEIFDHPAARPTTADGVAGIDRCVARASYATNHRECPISVMAPGSKAALCKGADAARLVAKQLQIAGAGCVMTRWICITIEMQGIFDIPGR